MKSKYFKLLLAAIIPILIASKMLELKIQSIPKSILNLNLQNKHNTKKLDTRFLGEENESQESNQANQQNKTSEFISQLDSTSTDKLSENSQKDEKLEVTAEIPLTKTENEFNETITREYNYTSHFWSVTAQIGEPIQEFILELDTTISTTWVPSVNCKNCATEQKYNASESRTSRETNKTIKVEDYLGDLKGEVVYDDFHINSMGISLRNFPFIQAIELNKKNYLDLPEGKLALSNVNKYGKKFSFLNSLVKSGKISRKLFALDFESGTSDEKKEEGKIYFGELPDKIKKLQKEQQFGLCNSTTNEDLDDEFRDGWTCEMTHLYFNQQKKLVNLTDAFEIKNARVIFDSSYEFIGASKNLYDMIYLNYIKQNFKGLCRKSEKNEEIYFICNLDKESLEKAESLFFILQGFVLELSASDLFVQLDENHNYLFAIKFFDADEKDSKILLLGHLFLKNFITIFDAEKDQVSFYSEKVYDIKSDWNTWYNTDFYSLLLSRYFYLAAGACIVTALFLMFICFLVFRSCRRKNYGHGPLIDNEIQ